MLRSLDFAVKYGKAAGVRLHTLVQALKGSNWQSREKLNLGYLRCGGGL